MGKINILEQDIASQIAAGEIIERPVSVVKELVENSIDAGSKNIIVEIEKGGKKSIRVIDDGEGISRDDIRLAFERHATSKINVIDDIFHINTLGFRGEALASIAAVSNLSVITKTRNESIGTICKISAGVIEDIGEIASKNGCLIEVKNLFFNTPARLKFLSSDTHENSRITDLITRFAMGNINISFRLIIDEKELFYSSGNGDYREVIAKVYGIDLAKQIIYIEKAFDNGKIWGYISKPSFNRGNRTGQTFFVNRRFVKDLGLTFCLERAYKTMIPIRRFPIAIIFIDIDNSLIDVNVHPSKMEIKFQNENQVHHVLFHVVNETLKNHVLIPKETLGISPVNRSQQQISIETQVELSSDGLPPDNEYNVSNNSNINSQTAATKEFVKEASTIIDVDAPKNDEHIQNHSYIPMESDETIQVIKKYEFQKILGQLFNTYIVVESKNRFYLIDQHAAHERILYEFYSKKYAKQLSDSQTLAAPYVLYLSAQEMMLLDNYKEDILKIGFDFSIFGSDSILIRSVPYIFNKPVDPITLRDVLDQINSNEYTRYPAKERLIISMSCHAAIKAGDVLSPIEIQELLDQLKQTEVPYTCPHGRPTIIDIALNELQKKFKRI